MNTQFEAKYTVQLQASGLLSPKGSIAVLQPRQWWFSKTVARFEFDPTIPGDRLRAVEQAEQWIETNSGEQHD